jgi:hypothetical protein
LLNSIEDVDIELKLSEKYIFTVFYLQGYIHLHQTYLLQLLHFISNFDEGLLHSQILSVVMRSEPLEVVRIPNAAGKFNLSSNEIK